MNNKIINIPTVLSEETIIIKALERLEKEYSDFMSFKGTEMFDKLLGIYKPKTSKMKSKSKNKDELPSPEPENAIEDESYTYNKNLKQLDAMSFCLRFFLFLHSLSTSFSNMIVYNISINW